MCDCGLPAKIFTAWTNKNPGRKFFGCELYKVHNSSAHNWLLFFLE